MNILTVSSLVLVLLGGFTRFGWPRALALAGATPAGAALVLGADLSVPTFAFVAVAAAASTGLRELQSKGPQRRTTIGSPVVLALVLFLLWAVVVTVVAPMIFNGVIVSGPAVGELRPLLAINQPTTSNVAQIVYIGLGIAVIVAVARDTAAARAVGLLLIVSTLLNLWALLHQVINVPFPAGVFDNSPSFRYIDTAPGGSLRFRGIFPEPAALAGSSLATLAYLASNVNRLRGLPRMATILLVGGTLWVLLVSTATTALVSGLVLLGVAGLSGGYAAVLQRRRISALPLVGLCIAALVLLVTLPLLVRGLGETVGDKVGSSSYDDRSGADIFSYSLTAQTFGFGVGLGNNRPSSLLASLLSTTGVLGTALFLGSIAFALWQAWARPEARATSWALLSFMITRFISSPDLADPSGLTWMCLGAMWGCVAGSRPEPEALIDDGGSGGRESPF